MPKPQGFKQRTSRKKLGLKVARSALRNLRNSVVKKMFGTQDFFGMWANLGKKQGARSNSSQSYLPRGTSFCKYTGYSRANLLAGNPER